MTTYIQKEDAAHAIDVQILAESLRGNGVAAGCEPTEGTGALEVDVGEGTVIYSGTDVSVNATTITLDAGETDSRFDTVYVDNTGTVQIAKGATAEEIHTGDDTTTFDADPFQYASPIPPDMTDFDGIPLAVIPVPAGATDYPVLRDVTLSTELVLQGVTYLEESVLPEFTDLINAPGIQGNLIYLNGGGSDPEGVYVHTGVEYRNVADEIPLSNISVDSSLDMLENDITNVSTVDINDTLRVHEGRGSFNLPEHHVRYGTTLAESEISRRSLAADEQFEVWLLDVNMRGGGTNSDFTVQVYDEDTATVLAETSDIVRGTNSPVGTSSTGADVTVRVTNATGANVDATISGQIYRVKQ